MVQRCGCWTMVIRHVEYVTHRRKRVIETTLGKVFDIHYL